MLINSSYLTVKNWVAQLKTGQFSTEDEDHPGSALLVTVLENVDVLFTARLGRSENFSQRDSRDSRDILGMC